MIITFYFISELVSVWYCDSTDHTLTKRIDSICDSFSQNKYTLGVFIDLIKVFGTMDHVILLNNPSLFHMKNSFKWCSSY